MTAAIEFECVAAGYPGRTVLHNLSFSITPGEMVGILGPNGAGKTTLFRTLTGLCRPASGAVRIFGRATDRLAAAERARLIAVVPQEVEASVAFSVEEVVMLGRTAGLSRWSAPTPEDRHIVERAMAQTDVIDMRHRSVTELSGGEKQRAIVAMALAQEPRIILMDEATSHLDMNHRLEIMEIVERLNREHGVTVMLISHDMNLTADFCRRVLLLDHGRLFADGTPDQVLTEDRLRHVYHCDVRVQRDAADGAISILPARRLREPPDGHRAAVHVIAGGGCAVELFRRLTLAGYRVSAGVLNDRDTDTEAALALGIPTATEKPFSPIGREALQKARELAADAEMVVVCGVPFGPGNVANLEIAEAAMAAGRRVLLLDGIEDRDYTPGREAVSRCGRMSSAGAETVRDAAALYAALGTLGR